MDEELKTAFINSLYIEYFETIYKYCLFKLSFDTDAANDCAHSVFDLARSKAEILHVHPNRLGWLYRSSTNMLRRRMKVIANDHARFVPFDELLNISDDSDPYELIALSEKDVEPTPEKILSNLYQDELELYRMRYVHKKSNEEIASILGISVPATRMRVSRIRFKIKKIIQQYLD